MLVSKLGTETANSDYGIVGVDVVVVVMAAADLQTSTEISLRYSPGTSVPNVDIILEMNLLKIKQSGQICCGKPSSAKPNIKIKKITKIHLKKTTVKLYNTEQLGMLCAI